MNPVGFLLRKYKHKHASRFSLHVSSSLLQLTLATPLHPAFPHLLALPLCPSFVSSKCLNPAAFCSHSSSTLVTTLRPTPHPPISSQLYLVVVGSQFPLRHMLTFKQKNYRSNHCKAIDLLGTEAGRCLTFCIIIYGRGRSWTGFSHKKCIYFWVQSTFFAMGPKTVLIHWLMVSGGFFPELRRQML